MPWPLKSLLQFWSFSKNNYRQGYVIMTGRNWSQKVTESSNALDLEKGVFTFKDPNKIAESLKRSAEKSSRRKGTPYQSAMSMLNFYINRAGTNLSEEQTKILGQAKIELKNLFQKPANPPVA